VLVPALVRTKAGAPVYTLTADDFLLTDDNSSQKLSLEQDTDSEPLALVVAVEIGGAGTRHLDDYRNLGSTIEALVGNVPHRVAIVGFDSEPRMLENFTSDLNATTSGLHDLDSGDSGAAILDGLKFSVEQLQKQPPEYRRAILLLSETVDHGSHIPLEDAVRAVSDTNTVIYSFAFSSTKSAATHEAGQFSSSEPGPPGGCFANDPNADPSQKKGKGEKTYDCLSLLAPPLRLAKIAALVAMNSMRQNASETVAHLTGGEYYSFKDRRSLQKGMLTVSNHVPNRYVLSFRPEAPHPGLHTLKLQLKDYPNLQITARRNYWAQDTTAGTAKP
jgi:VWFA-related protein